MAPTRSSVPAASRMPSTIGRPRKQRIAATSSPATIRYAPSPASAYRPDATAVPPGPSSGSPPTCIDMSATAAKMPPASSKMPLTSRRRL